MVCVRMWQAGASVDAQDGAGSSPLHVAVAVDNVEAVQWLLARNCRLELEARPPDLAPGAFR